MSKLKNKKSKILKNKKFKILKKYIKKKKFVKTN